MPPCSPQELRMVQSPSHRLKPQCAPAAPPPVNDGRNECQSGERSGESVPSGRRAISPAATAVTARRGPLYARLEAAASALKNCAHRHCSTVRARIGWRAEAGVRTQLEGLWRTAWPRSLMAPECSSDATSRSGAPTPKQLCPLGRHPQPIAIGRRAAVI